MARRAYLDMAEEKDHSDQCADGHRHGDPRATVSDT